MTSSRRGPYKPPGVARPRSPILEKRSGRWLARVVDLDGKTRDAGRHATRELAAAAAIRKAEELNDPPPGSQVTPAVKVVDVATFNRSLPDLTQAEYRMVMALVTSGGRGAVGRVAYAAGLGQVKSRRALTTLIRDRRLVWVPEPHVIELAVDPSQFGEIVVPDERLRRLLWPGLDE
jgi:hypothetical protein